MNIQQPNQLRFARHNLETISDISLTFPWDFQSQPTAVVCGLLRAGLVEDGRPGPGGGVAHGENKDHETMGQDTSELKGSPEAALLGRGTVAWMG